MDKMKPDTTKPDIIDETLRTFSENGMYPEFVAAVQALKQSNTDKQAEIDRLLVAVANQSVRLAGKKPDVSALAEKIVFRLLASSRLRATNWDVVRPIVAEVLEAEL